MITSWDRARLALVQRGPWRALAEAALAADPAVAAIIVHERRHFPAALPPALHFEIRGGDVARATSAIVARSIEDRGHAEGITVTAYQEAAA